MMRMICLLVKVDKITTKIVMILDLCKEARYISEIMNGGSAERRNIS